MPQDKNSQQGRNNRYLIGYLRKLRQLNDFEIDVPQADINEVVKDPRQYALDFIELEFARTVPKFIKAYGMGFDFGKKNK